MYINMYTFSNTNSVPGADMDMLDTLEFPLAFEQSDEEYEEPIKSSISINVSVSFYFLRPRAHLSRRNPCKISTLQPRTRPGVDLFLTTTQLWPQPGVWFSRTKRNKKYTIGVR